MPAQSTLSAAKPKASGAHRRQEVTKKCKSTTNKKHVVHEYQGVNMLDFPPLVCKTCGQHTHEVERDLLSTSKQALLR